MADGPSTPNPFAAWQKTFEDWTRAMSGTRASAPNPFAPWQTLVQEWTKTVAGAGGAAAPGAPAGPMPFWQEWLRTSTAPAAGTAAPFAAWQEAFKAWAPASAGTTNPLELWLSTFQKWMETSAQFVSMGRPSAEFGLFNPFQAFNPFAAFTPTQLWQQLLQQYLNAWTEFTARSTGEPPAAELFRGAERAWLGYLDSVGKELSTAMSSEEFVRALGTSLEQSLVMQERQGQAYADQVNEFLRFFHLPSRSQVDRLFERVISLEERLDDLEAQGLALLKELRSASKAANGRAKAASAARESQQ